MATFKVAHINEQGVDLIVVPLDSQFGLKTEQAKKDVTEALQRCATAAGLKGTVVPIWHEQGDHWGFIAPLNFHAFFTTVDFDLLLLSVNRELTCEGY